MATSQHQSSIPHPNQVRSACERCRRQKLRCTRSPAASPSCTRCTRLNLPCQAGPQRRIGRPPKKDLVAIRKASGAATAPGRGSPGPLLVAAGPILIDELQLLDDGLLDDSIVPGFDWTKICSPVLGFSSLSLPIECWPGVRELEAPPEHQIISPGPRIFEALSRLNAEIYKCRDNVVRFQTQPNFKDFICTPHPIMDGYKNIQLLLVNAQEYLTIIKDLHRQIGTQPITKSTRSVSPDPNPMNISGPSTPSSGRSSSSGASSLPKTPDSPTIFLVISCYVQLVKHTELLIKIIYDSINDPTTDPIGRAPMAFADVPIIESSTQFILFLEMVHHIVLQTNLVLGLPSRWTGRSMWGGILRCQRHRDLINAELGSVEGPWTTRPTGLLELISMTKDIFIEVSMLGIEPEHPISGTCLWPQKST